MSADDDGGPGNREVAYRVFAAEYEDADFSYSESDEERAPNYVITPTGARANRLFVIGVLTETERVNDDVLRARIVDTTGAYVAYAGQYQPDELAFLERADPPMFVALSGKARTFQPDDSGTVYTSVRPESINEVDAATRDRWVVTTAEQTLDRVATMAEALAREERGEDLATALVADGASEARASGVALAIEHYHTTPTYLQAVREMALDAARVVADDLDEVGALTTDPDQEGAATLSDLTDVDAGAVSDSTTAATSEADTPAEATAEATSTDTTTGTSTEPDTTTDTGAPDTAATSSEVATDTTADDDSGPETGESRTQDETDEPATGTTESDVTDTAETTDTPDEQGPATDVESEPTAGEEDDIGDFEPGEFDLDEEEREEVEQQYGTDFETGNTVEEPGEADIETPDPEDLDAQADADAEAETEPEPEPDTDSEPEPEPATEPEPETETESEPDAESETEAESDSEPEPDTEADAEADADVDLEDAVVDVMGELNGDSGAERAAVIDTVVDRYGADPDDVEDAIQDALMDGRCYEPDDTTLKPI
jgi:RPA family protein